MDPAELIKLYRFEINKNVRRVEISSFDLSAGESTTDLEGYSSFLAFDPETEGRNLVRIVLTGTLQPGEYALTYAGGQNLFAFGID